MNGPTLVTGATGTLGRVVVERLRAMGASPRVLSRRPTQDGVTGDLLTGAGIDDAVRGAPVIVHCATGPRRDTAATRTLVDAARRSGGARPHLVYISIVGVDRVPLGYYREKLAAEQLITGSGLSWTILRATQFHDLLAWLFGKLAGSPVLPVLAGTSFQPVGVADVAERLVTLATGSPAGRVPDLGGPQIHRMADLARAWLAANGRGRLVLPVRPPGAVARGYREGGHLTPDHRDGRMTFADFLAAAPAGRQP